MLEIQNCAASITNVNARKELNGEDRVPAFDINISIRVAAELFKGLLPDYDGFIKTIWNEHKELRTTAIKQILFHDVAFENGSLIIKDGMGNETEFKGCKVCKFKYFPGNFQIAQLDFQVQYSAEKEEEIVPAYKAEQQDGVLVTIVANPKEGKAKGDSDTQVDAFDGSEQEDEAA